MHGRSADIHVETIAAESAKFTAPLLFIHGLWCTAAVWRPFMGYCAHRGWMCTALHLRGHAGADRDRVAGASFADYLDDARRAVAACVAPPVLVGHDLGGLLALHSGAPAVRAIVALAPLIPGGAGAARRVPLSSLRARLAIWRRSPLPPPRGATGAAYLGSALSSAVPESSALARALRTGGVPQPVAPHVPMLLMAGDRDLFSPPEAVAALAESLGGTFSVAADAGHPMPWAPGWEQRVSELHRWLVRTLGESLLVEREEEE